MIKNSMAATQLKDVVERFTEYYLYSPMMTGVGFGCDCGCGGNSFSEESWDNYEKDAKAAYFEFRNFCHCNGIIWDYPNLFNTEEIYSDDFPAPASAMASHADPEVKDELKEIKATGVEDKVAAFCKQMGIPTE